MKARFLATVPVAAAIIVSAIAIAKPQIGLSPNQWQYATISSPIAYVGKPVREGEKFRFQYDAHVAICYVTATGCKEETVNLSLSRLENIETPYIQGNIAGAQRDVFAKALAQLASQGWEVIGQGPDPTITVNVSEILYLKRPMQPVEKR